jgi:hypothetical protein
MGGLSPALYRLVVPARHAENVQNLGAYQNIGARLKFTDFYPTKQSLSLPTGVLPKSGKHINAHHHCPISVFILTSFKLEAKLEIQRYGLFDLCTGGGGGREGGGRNHMTSLIKLL